MLTDQLIAPFRSQEYRTIKLLFIGKEKRGKTTLLRRLKNIPDPEVDRTVGIDIEDWTYSEPRRFPFFRPVPKPVHFLAWDFAGQVCLVLIFVTN